MSSSDLNVIGLNFKQNFKCTQFLNQFSDLATANHHLNTFISARKPFEVISDNYNPSLKTWDKREMQVKMLFVPLLPKVGG